MSGRLSSVRLGHWSWEMRELGPRPEALGEAAPKLLAIPMEPGVDSLNAGVAGAILLFALSPPWEEHGELMGFPLEDQWKIDGPGRAPGPSARLLPERLHPPVARRMNRW